NHQYQENNDGLQSDIDFQTCPSPRTGPRITILIPHMARTLKSAWAAIPWDMYSRLDSDYLAPEISNRQLAFEGTAILERTGESIARSQAIAIETENVGNEVLNELGAQREALLHTQSRLENTNENLVKTKTILNKLGRNVIYNKVILILIILIELVILILLSYLKFLKH
ncbi:hypothetical protein NQ315_007975, partial [Exocentrus adspersus]